MKDLGKAGTFALSLVALFLTVYIVGYAWNRGSTGAGIIPKM